MKTKLFATLSLILITLTVLTACGGGARSASTERPPEGYLMEPAAPAEPADDSGFAGAPAVGQEAEKSALPMPTAGVVYQTVPDVDNAPGQAAYVPKRYAHRSINTGSTPLVTFFAFRGDAGHNYGTIETKGFRKIVVEKNGQPEIIDNPNWK